MPSFLLGDGCERRNAILSCKKDEKLEVYGRQQGSAVFAALGVSWTWVTFCGWCIVVGGWVGGSRPIMQCSEPACNDALFKSDR